MVWSRVHAVSRSDPTVANGLLDPRNELLEDLIQRGERLEPEQALAFSTDGTRRCTS